MKRVCALILLLSVLLLTACSTDETTETIVPDDNAPTLGYTQITMEEAVSMMEEIDEYIILDVRTFEEFREKHIPDAVCIPNETILDTPPALLPDMDAIILVYCRSGNRSKQAAEKLAALGYGRVYEFGGIIDWNGETVSGD